MNKQLKSLLLMSAFTTTLLGAGITAAEAQSKAPKGSIALEQTDQSEDGEVAAYASLAKVTLEQAVKAAQDALGTQTAPTSAQLGNEDGFLAWEVILGTQTVTVDAGNTKILQTEKTSADEGQDDNDGSDEMSEGKGATTEVANGGASDEGEHESPSEPEEADDN